MTTLTALGNEFRLNTLTSPMVDVAQNPVVIAELAGGGFVAIWQVAASLFFPQDGSQAAIFGQVFDNAGNPVGSMFQVDGATPTAGSTGTLNQQTLPSVTGLADGGFVVAWQSDHDAARGFDIYGQRYDATGTRVGTTQFQVNDQATNPLDIQNVSINSVPTGGYLATWSQTSAAGNYEVFGRYFDAAGTPTTGNFQINTTTTLNQFMSSAAVFSDGSAIVVWQSDQDAGGGGFGIYGQRVNANGTLNGGQLTISTTTAGAQFGPSVVALGDINTNTLVDDGFVVVWASENQDGNGTAIIGQRYDNAFVKVGSEFVINQTTVGDQSAPSITAVGNGDIVVTWQSPGVDGTTDVFARRFDASAGVTPVAVTNEQMVNQSIPGAQATGTTVHTLTTTTRAFDHNVVQLSNGDLAIVWSDAATSDVFGRLFSVNVATTDAPVVTAFARNPVFGTEFGVNRAPVDLFHTVNVTTEGGDNVDVLTLTVRNVVNGAAEKLRIDGTLIDLIAGSFGPTAGGFSGTVAVSGTTATVTINAGLGGATAAQITTLIDGLAYDNESTTPGPTRRIVTLTSISDTNDNGTPGADTRTLVATSSTVSPPRVNEIASVSTDYVQQTQPPANSGATVTVFAELLNPGFGDAARYISSDGRFVVFASSATNLVAGDTNGDVNGIGQDVFLRDMLTGTTERISINDDETQIIGGIASGMVSISADGNRVLFHNGDLFVRDRADQTTTDVTFSVEGNPVTAFAFAGVVAEISGDGTKVAFSAAASQIDFVAGDANNAADIFLRDLTADTTVRVSLTDDDLAPNGGSAHPSISATGRYVAFLSAATNMVTAASEGGLDTNGLVDVFRRDLQTGETIRVSLTENDLQSTANPAGGGTSFPPAISADGNLVVFTSLARLTSGDTDNLQDIYLRNISAGTTTLISNSPLLLASTSNVAPSISPDGRYVAYGSTDNNAVFIFDTQTGLTSRAQVFTNGFQGEASPGVFSALANGYIAFSSGFNHLVPTDVNGGSVQDIFTASIDSLVLGGTIWNDSAGGITGDGIKQAGEIGIPGVRLSLFADLNNDDIPDTPDSPVRMTFTSGTGDYQFNGLAPGNYIVRVDQDNFDAGGVSVALVATPISPGGPPDNPADPDDNIDSDDNGARVSGQAGFSKAITLDYATEPDGVPGGPGDTDGDANASTNLTLDFGFMANPPPVINDLAGDTSIFTEQGPAAVLDQGTAATVADTNNANFNGGFLTVSITGAKVAAEDVLGISVAGSVLLSNFTNVGSIVSVGGQPIGVIAASGTGIGTDNLIVNFNTTDATLANVSTLIQALTYSNTNTTAPSTTARTINVLVNDGLGASDNENVTVNVVDINDEPTLIANGVSVGFTEGGAGVLLFNSADADTIEPSQTFASLQLTVTNVTDGALQGQDEILQINGVDVALNNGNSVGLGGNAGTAGVVLSVNTATVTINGATLTALQLETLVNGITYRNVSQVPAEAANRVITITQVVDSGLGTGSNDNTATLSIASTVDVAAVNDTPAFAGLDGTPTFTEDGPAVVLDNNALLSDLELDAANNYNGATLTLARNGGTNPDDDFNDDSGTLAFGATSVSIGVTQVGTYTQVNGTLAITFNSAATSALVDSVLQQLSYRNASNDPTTPTVQVNYAFSDGNAGAQGSGGAGIANGSVVVSITALNDPPALDLDASDNTALGNNFSGIYTPGGAAVPVADTDTLIVDPDDTNIESATINIATPQTGDLVDVDTGLLPGEITKDLASTPTNLILTGSASEAAYESALELVRFSNSLPAPDQTPRTINITVNDGTALSNTAVSTILLTLPPSVPVDDDPDADVVTEGALAGTEVQIDVSSTDPDVPPTAVTFSFAPGGDAGGRFAIDPVSGVVTVSAAGAGTIDFEGSAGSYDVTIRATDGAGGFSDALFTINVNDVVTTTPVDGVAPDGGSVQEGAANGTAVGIDADSTDVNGGTVTFAITAGNTGNAFAIDGNGVITVNDATQIDFETLTSYLLTVQASTVGSILVSTQSFTVDVTNAAPAFDNDIDPAVNSVSEGAANGDTVGVTAQFVDPNGGTVTYSLANDAGGRFTVHPTTGVVTVANASLINFESQTPLPHLITVRASDSSGEFNDHVFGIFVINVPPVALGDGFSVAEDQTLNAPPPGVLFNDSDVNGGPITAVLDVGPANAAVFALQSDGSFSYQPNGNFNGPDSFTYHAFDDTDSSTIVTVNLTVTAVNDAPVLNPAATPVLNTVNEDPGAPVGAVGTLVSSLVDFVGGGGLDNVTDIDSATTGIGLRGADMTNGTWHFSTDGGANWSLVPLSVSDVVVLRLAADASTRLYFQPNANFNGTSSITFRAWDQSTGGNGTLALDPEFGGTSSFSLATDTASITVNAVNDAPALSNVAATVTLRPIDPPIVLDPDLVISDVDSPTLVSATVRVSAGIFVGDGNVLAADTTGTAITAIYNPGTETLTLTGSDTLANYEQVLETVTFQTTSIDPTNSGANPTRTIEWQLNDGSGLNNLSTIQTTTVNVAGAPASDANGDGKSDILWQNDNGQPGIWLMNGLSVISDSTVGFNPGPTWNVIDSGDFNGDGKSDILWQNDNGQAGVWLMDGFSVIADGGVGFNPGPTWDVKASGDFNGDGMADILWQNDNGQAGIWLMDGLSVIADSGVGFNPGPTWNVIDSGDFNGDGKSDILWQNDNGQAGIWLMDGFSVIADGGVGFNPGSSWNVQASGDFNGDGKSDILWQNDNGQAGIWLMDGLSVIADGGVGFNPGPTWKVHDAADYNGDGMSDILWQNDNGQPGIWLMDGLSVLADGGVGFNPGPTWHVIGQHDNLI